MIKFSNFLQEEVPVWKKPKPESSDSGMLTPSQKARAKARAKNAGRTYPNLVDNMWAARTGEANEEKIAEARRSRRIPPGERLLKHIQDYEKRTKQPLPAPEQKQDKVKTEEVNLPRLGSNPGKFKRLVGRHLGAKAAEKISGGDGSRIMAKAKKTGNTNLFRQGSFIKNFYGEEAALKEKTLGKPFRTPGGPKKFSVYVRNEKGNEVKVNFGDPNLSIKRDSPVRRKSFRARHNCANPGPRTKARYWSCRQWRAGAKVEA